MADNYPPIWRLQSDATTAFLRAARSGNLEKVIEYLDTDLDINTANSNGLNALHLASKDGHVEIVTELLKRGAKVDAATKKGNTALHIASLAGQSEIVNILIQYGAAVNIQSQNGFTPLYMAAQENHDQVVKILLNNGANQSLATEDGFTPLAVAMQQGHDKVVSVLLENDSKGRVRLPALHIAAKKDDCKAADLLLQNDHKPDVTSKSGFTPLHIAAHYGNEEIARLLIKRGADVNYLAKHNISPLHVAAKWGKNNMVKILLENGAVIDAKTRDGLTPLHCAARSGHEQCVTTLLENSAPISARTKNGLAPLHMASQGDHVDAARVLLYHRAPVDEVTIDYLTSLHVAAHCGHVRVAKLLLDRKADPNARALNGFTPLHIACKKNRIKVVELLLKHGASIESTTESGLTPLHVASFMGCMNIVIFLLQHEANPDVPTVRGETPLHLAARANQTDIIRILLRNGAKVDARAREQQTPLHIASRLGNVDIVMLLLQHGAAVDTTTKDMYTALHIAAKEGQEEVAAILVDNNASVKATTKNGFTPLHVAAKYGNMNVAKILLQKDSKLDSQGKNDITPLLLACHYDHPNVAQLLLEKGASPYLASQNGQTPLHIAARKNQMDIASTLLEHGAKADVESKAGFTPLHLSAQKGHYDMTNLLIEHGADPNHKAKNGLTALHLCAQEDFIRVASILVKCGANVESETETGYRPIHVAAHFGNLSMIRFLLKHNAEIDVKTKQNYTPLHQAAQQGHAHIVSALIEGNASHRARTNDGLTALNIAQKLGYISVMEVLKGLSYDGVTPDNKNWEEKYKVIAPESLQETSLMSDSDDEGGSDALISEQPYRYLTADLMKSLRDDSLPIDVTRDDPVHRPVTKEEHQEFVQSNNYCSAENFDSNDFTKFLVSFLVDARGGTMKGCRHSGIRLIVPPRRATMPIRVTCRLVKPSKMTNPPPLMEGESLSTRVIEMGPVGASFLGPVLIDIPHFASVSGKEREIIILRSENGETWKEHDNSADNDDTLLNTPYDLQMSSLHSGRIIRILTTEFPQYFAIVTRIKQEVHVIGAEGGILISSVANQVQAVFPPGALTKKIKVGLQAHVIPTELTAKLLGNCVAVSPVITIEPRRRKFHKPISLTLPVPQAANKGMINHYGGETPTLRLLCSIAGGTSEAQWEDVTGSTPLNFMNDRVSFTTTVSARFWLMDCRNIQEVPKMATDLYRESLHVPFITNFVIYSKRMEEVEATLRILCMTDSKEGIPTLEKQEEFMEIVKSRDVETLDGKDLYIEFSGNLVPVTKSGVQLKFTFKAFRQNRLSFHVKVKDPQLDPVARMMFMREPKVAKGEPAQQPLCVLNIVLPEITYEEKYKGEDSNIISQKMDVLKSKYKIDYNEEKGDQPKLTSPSEKKFITDTLQKEQTDAAQLLDQKDQLVNSTQEGSQELELSPSAIEKKTYSEKRRFWEDIARTKRESFQRSESEVSHTSQLTYHDSDSECLSEVRERSEDEGVDRESPIDTGPTVDMSEYSVAEKAHYFEEQIQKEMTAARGSLKSQSSLESTKLAARLSGISISSEDERSLEVFEETERILEETTKQEMEIKIITKKTDVKTWEDKKDEKKDDIMEKDDKTKAEELNVDKRKDKDDYTKKDDKTISKDENKDEKQKSKEGKDLLENKEEFKEGKSEKKVSKEEKELSEIKSEKKDAEKEVDVKSDKKKIESTVKSKLEKDLITKETIGKVDKKIVGEKVGSSETKMSDIKTKTPSKIDFEKESKPKATKMQENVTKQQKSAESRSPVSTIKSSKTKEETLSKAGITKQKSKEETSPKSIPIRQKSKEEPFSKSPPKRDKLKDDSLSKSPPKKDRLKEDAAKFSPKSEKIKEIIPVKTQSKVEKEMMSEKLPLKKETPSHEPLKSLISKKEKQKEDISLKSPLKNEKHKVGPISPPKGEKYKNESTKSQIPIKQKLESPPKESKLDKIPLSDIDQLGKVEETTRTTMLDFFETTLVSEELQKKLVETTDFESLKSLSTIQELESKSTIITGKLQDEVLKQVDVQSMSEDRLLDKSIVSSIAEDKIIQDISMRSTKDDIPLSTLPEKKQYDATVSTTEKTEVTKTQSQTESKPIEESLIKLPLGKTGSDVSLSKVEQSTEGIGNYDQLKPTIKQPIESKIVTITKVEEFKSEPLGVSKNITVIKSIVESKVTEYTSIETATAKEKVIDDTTLLSKGTKLDSDLTKLQEKTISDELIVQEKSEVVESQKPIETKIKEEIPSKIFEKMESDSSVLVSEIKQKDHVETQLEIQKITKKSVSTDEKITESTTFQPTEETELESSATKHKEAIEQAMTVPPDEVKLKSTIPLQENLKETKASEMEVSKDHTLKPLQEQKVLETKYDVIPSSNESLEDTGLITGKKKLVEEASQLSILKEKIQKELPPTPLKKDDVLSDTSLEEKDKIKKELPSTTLKKEDVLSDTSLEEKEKIEKELPPTTLKKDDVLSDTSLEKKEKIQKELSPTPLKKDDVLSDTSLEEKDKIEKELPSTTLKKEDVLSDTSLEEKEKIEKVLPPTTLKKEDVLDAFLEKKEKIEKELPPAPLKKDDVLSDTSLEEKEKIEKELSPTTLKKEDVLSDTSLEKKEQIEKELPPTTLKKDDVLSDTSLKEKDKIEKELPSTTLKKDDILSDTSLEKKEQIEKELPLTTLKKEDVLDTSLEEKEKIEKELPSTMLKKDDILSDTSLEKKEQIKKELPLTTLKKEDVLDTSLEEKEKIEKELPPTTLKKDDVLSDTSLEEKDKIEKELPSTTLKKEDVLSDTSLEKKEQIEKELPSTTLKKEDVLSDTSLEEKEKIEKVLPPTTLKKEDVLDAFLEKKEKIEKELPPAPLKKDDVLSDTSLEEKEKIEKVLPPTTLKKEDVLDAFLEKKEKIEKELPPAPLKKDDVLSDTSLEEKEKIEKELPPTTLKKEDVLLDISLEEKEKIEKELPPVPLKKDDVLSDISFEEKIKELSTTLEQEKLKSEIPKSMIPRREKSKDEIIIKSSSKDNTSEDIIAPKQEKYAGEIPKSLIPRREKSKDEFTVKSPPADEMKKESTPSSAPKQEKSVGEIPKSMIPRIEKSKDEFTVKSPSEDEKKKESPVTSAPKREKSVGEIPKSMIPRIEKSKDEFTMKSPPADEKKKESPVTSAPKREKSVGEIPKSMIPRREKSKDEFTMKSPPADEKKKESPVTSAPKREKSVGEIPKSMIPRREKSKDEFTMKSPPADEKKKESPVTSAPKREKSVGEIPKSMIPRREKSKDEFSIKSPPTDKKKELTPSTPKQEKSASEIPKSMIPKREKSKEEFSLKSPPKREKSRDELPTTSVVKREKSKDEIPKSMIPKKEKSKEEFTLKSPPKREKSKDSVPVTSIAIREKSKEEIPKSSISKREKSKDEIPKSSITKREKSKDEIPKSSIPKREKSQEEVSTKSIPKREKSKDEISFKSGLKQSHSKEQSSKMTAKKSETVAKTIPKKETCKEDISLKSTVKRLDSKEESPKLASKKTTDLPSKLTTKKEKSKEEVPKTPLAKRRDSKEISSKTPIKRSGSSKDSDSTSSSIKSSSSSPKATDKVPKKEIETVTVTKREKSEEVTTQEYEEHTRKHTTESQIFSGTFTGDPKEALKLLEDTSALNQADFVTSGSVITSKVDHIATSSLEKKEIKSSEIDTGQEKIIAHEETEDIQKKETSSSLLKRHSPDEKTEEQATKIKEISLSATEKTLVNLTEDLETIRASASQMGKENEHSTISKSIEDDEKIVKTKETASSLKESAVGARVKLEKDLHDESIQKDELGNIVEKSIFQEETIDSSKTFDVKEDFKSKLDSKKKDASQIMVESVKSASVADIKEQKILSPESGTIDSEVFHDELADDLTRKFENIMQKSLENDKDVTKLSTVIQEEPIDITSTHDSLSVSISEDITKDESSSFQLSSSQAKIPERDITMSPSSMSEQIEIELDENDANRQKQTLSSVKDTLSSVADIKIDTKATVEGKFISELSGARVLEILEPDNESQSRQDSMDVSSIEIDEVKFSSGAYDFPIKEEILHESPAIDSLETLERDVTMSPVTFSEDTNVDYSLPQDNQKKQEISLQKITVRRKTERDSFEIESPPLVFPRLKIKELEIKPVDWMIGDEKIEVSETLEPSQAFDKELEEYQSSLKQQENAESTGKKKFEIPRIEETSSSSFPEPELKSSVKSKFTVVPVSEQDLDIEKELVENKLDISCQELMDTLQREYDAKTPTGDRLEEMAARSFHFMTVDDDEDSFDYDKEKYEEQKQMLEVEYDENNKVPDMPLETKTAVNVIQGEQFMRLEETLEPIEGISKCKDAELLQLYEEQFEEIVQKKNSDLKKSTIEEKKSFELPTMTEATKKSLDIKSTSLFEEKIEETVKSSVVAMYTQKDIEKKETDSLEKLDKSPEPIKSTNNNVTTSEDILFVEEKCEEIIQISDSAEKNELEREKQSYDLQNLQQQPETSELLLKTEEKKTEDKKDEVKLLSYKTFDPEEVKVKSDEPAVVTTIQKPPRTEFHREGKVDLRSKGWDDHKKTDKREKSHFSHQETSPYKMKKEDFQNVDMSSRYAITVLDQVVKKEIAEVKENLEAAKQDLIEELSENSETVIQIKDSPSEFQFKLQPESIPNELPFLYKAPSLEKVSDAENLSSSSSPIAKPRRHGEIARDRDESSSESSSAEKKISDKDLSKTSIVIESESDKSSQRESKDIFESFSSSPKAASRSGSDAEGTTKDETFSLQPPQPAPRRRQKPARGHHRVASESEADVSSSGESNYQSCEYETSSRPSSSDIEALQSAAHPSSTTASEYETAMMSFEHSSSKAISQDYHTAVSTLSSRESMKSLTSLSSGQMGSIDSTSELSETLMASEPELDKDEIDENLESVLDDDMKTSNYASEDESSKPFELDPDIPCMMKRSSEMIFSQVINQESSGEGTSLDVKQSDSSIKMDKALETDDFVPSMTTTDKFEDDSTTQASMLAEISKQPSEIMDEPSTSSSEQVEPKPESSSFEPDSLEMKYTPMSSIEDESAEGHVPGSGLTLQQQLSMTSSSMSGVSLETVIEKEQTDRNSPDSDSFEMVDKPDIIDDFVVVEEVGREAEEFDSEGKGIRISSMSYTNSKNFDRDVENLIAEKSDAQKPQAQSAHSTTDVFDFESEESPPQASNDDQYSQSFSDDEQYNEGGRKWIEMQFQQNEARLYDLEYERGPLEDIKEEEVTDFEAGSSRFGSIGSHKESIGSIGSMRGSFGSTPDNYDIITAKRYFKPTDHDNVSLSSLQEFEHLESAVALENAKRREQQQSSSQDSSSNGSLPRRYITSRSGHGDDISLSSVKDFEVLEKACKEAHMIELRAREEEDLLDHESPENRYKLENLARSKVESQESAPGSFNPSTSGSDDYEKRIKEIDEIIRIAQANVEKIDRHDDTTEDISQIDLTDTADRPIAPVTVIAAETSIMHEPARTITEPNVMETSTDSLELDGNGGQNYNVMCRSSDSLELKTTLDYPSLSSDSLNNVKDSKEDQERQFSSSRRISSDSLEFPVLESQDTSKEDKAKDSIDDS